MRPPSTPPSPALLLQDGQDPRTRAAAARALDARSLRAVFMDLVGRPPRRAEAQEWLGRGRGELLDDLLGSEEFWAHWWHEQLYYFLLIDNFRPRTRAAKEVPTKLAEGRLHYRDALHQAALTPTFDLRNPGADTFVTVVMEQFCGVVVQDRAGELEIGKVAYEGGKGRFLGTTAENQADVIRICVEHRDASRHFLAREHQRLLRRDLERKQLRKDAGRLHRDPWAYLALVREWLLSEAYDQRLAALVPKSNSLFVRCLFVDLLDRLPEDDELEPMRNALDGLADSRPLRSVVVRLLLESGRAAVPAKAAIEDPTRWIGQQFPRFLGREATPEELRVFVTAFHEEGCEPSTILYALLSHSEYQSY